MDNRPPADKRSTQQENLNQPLFSHLFIGFNPPNTIEMPYFYFTLLLLLVKPVGPCCVSVKTLFYANAIRTERRSVVVEAGRRCTVLE